MSGNFEPTQMWQPCYSGKNECESDNLLPLNVETAKDPIRMRPRFRVGICSNITTFRAIFLPEILSEMNVCIGIEFQAKWVCHPEILFSDQNVISGRISGENIWLNFVTCEPSFTLRSPPTFGRYSNVAKFSPTFLSVQCYFLLENRIEMIMGLSQFSPKFYSNTKYNFRQDIRVFHDKYI